jgi:hypothetical protein
MITHITVFSVTIGRTVNETATRFAECLREYATDSEMNFTLRAPFDLSTCNLGLTLHRDVTARITPRGKNGRAYAIFWHPVEPGPFPLLSGTVFIGASETHEDQSIVTLDGHYHPPLGVVGEMFDALVGKHIAETSASDLMDRVAADLGNVVVPVSAFAFAKTRRRPAPHR